MPIVRVRDLRFAYGRGPAVLDVPEFHVDPGERVFLRGPSGSGKTTLLGLLTGVLSPPTGSVFVLDHDLGALSGRARDRLRGAHLGYVFQLFNLLPYLDVRANITLPCRFSAERRRRLRGEAPAAAAARIAAGLGIEELLGKRVGELSVGQQQRVAVARALLGAPELVVADEPTSALDADHRDRFVELLFSEAQRAGSAVLLVSHDRALGQRFDRVVDLPAINRAAPGRASGEPTGADP